MLSMQPAQGVCTPSSVRLRFGFQNGRQIGVLLREHSTSRRTDPAEGIFYSFSAGYQE